VVYLFNIYLLLLALLFVIPFLA